MLSHFLLAAGASPATLFPALAVARELVRAAPGARCTLAGTGGAWETHQVRQAGFDYFAVAQRGLPRSAWNVLRTVAENWTGYRAAARFLRDESVSAVVTNESAMGLTLGRAALARRVPLAIIEPNAVPSKTTRALASSSALVCGAFPELRGHLRSDCPLRITGVPLRGDFSRQRQREYQRAAIAEHRASQAGIGRKVRLPSPRPPRLVVLGGGPGSHALNRYVPRALYKLGEARNGWQIVHQTGRGDLEVTRELYRKLAVPALVVPLITDLPRTLARADLAVSRSGGSILAKLSAAGVPAVLLPHAQADRDHQLRNAEVLAAEGATVLVDARRIEGRLDDHLAGVLRGLTSDPARRRTMAEALQRRARPDAAWQAAQLIAELVTARHSRQAG